MEISKGRSTAGKKSSKNKDLKAGHDWHLPRPQRRPRGMDVGGAVRGVEKGWEEEWDSHKGTCGLYKQFGFYSECD